MAKKLDPAKELTTWEDIAYSNMVQDEAAGGKLLGMARSSGRYVKGDSP